MSPRPDRQPPRQPPEHSRYSFDSAEREQQLKREEDELKKKPLEELRGIFQSETDAFKQQKEKLDILAQELIAAGKDLSNYPLNLGFEDVAQEEQELYARAIYINRDRTNEMHVAYQRLKRNFPGTVTPPQGEPSRLTKEQRDAREEITKVVNWYREQTRKIKQNKAPIDPPLIIIEMEENQNNRYLAGTAAFSDIATAKQEWEETKNEYQGKHVGETERTNAEEKFNAALEWFEEEINRVKQGDPDSAEPTYVANFLTPDNLAHLKEVVRIKVDKARAKLAEARIKRDKESEKKQKEEDNAEAKRKLELAREWLNKLEEKVNDANSNLADLKIEFNKIGGHPNSVFQAREFIREKNLATDDKIKPENDKMEKWLEEIEKKIKEREKEKLAGEVKEVSDKLNAFLAEIQKQPGEFGPRYDTVEKRTREWDELLAEINPVLVRANAAPVVARELRADLLPIEELRNRTIPEALAAAALRTARDKVLKAEEILDSLKTYDDLINKIKEHKTAVEGREVPVPPNELINDTDVDDWLEEFNRRALEETNNAREFLDQHGFAANPNFIPNIENLNKEIARYEDLLEKKMAALREVKHRARVKEAVTSKTVQKGTAKRAAMFPGVESAESRQIDIDEIKKNEVWGQVINVLLSEHGFLGREKGGTEAEATQSEASIIRRLQHEFGPDSQFYFSNEQCEDLFYAAKSWLFERLSLQAMGERRQAMPEAAEDGGVEAKPALAAPAKGGWKKIALKALVWTGLGLGAAAAAPLAGFSALAGFGAVGALRVIDNIRHHFEEHRKFNKEKQRLQGDDKFRDALVEHLSFTVANLRENNLRQDQAHLEYNDYFQNIREHLAHENDEREKPLSTAELDKTAAAFAVFYETDDAIERERMGREVNRSANARHWWEYIDAALGQAVRGGAIGKGWQISNPSRRLFSGSAWMGASFGLMAAREMVPGLKFAMRGYAGWKIGGAVTDWWAGKRSPENATEEQLTKLELTVPNLEKMNLPALGEQIKALSDCRAMLNAISNSVEYARQKERLKEVLMATLAEKILKEEAAHELTEQAEIAGMGERVAGEVGHFYVEGREQQAEQEGRVNRYRVYGRVLGAAGMMVGGLWLENFLHDLFSKPIPHGKGARVMEEPTPAPRRGPEGVEGLPPVEHPPVGPMPVLEDAVVHKGEGVEHALRRQIEADPEKWGYTGKGSVHRFAGHEAHRIANELGYVKGGGLETRVRLIDQVAYILDKDSSGRSVVDEVRVHKMPDDTFMPDQPIAGGTSSGLDEYEYGYKKPAATTPVIEDHPVHEWSASKEPAEYKLVDGKSLHLMPGQIDGENQTLVFDADGHRFGFVDEHGVVQHSIPAGGWPIGSPENIDLHAGVAAAAATEAPSGDAGEVSADANVAEPDGVTREFEDIKAQAESGHGTIKIEEESGVGAGQGAIGAAVDENAALTAEQTRNMLTGQYVDISSSLNTTEHLSALKEALEKETTHSLRLNSVDYKLVDNDVNFEVAGQRGAVGGKNIDILRDFHKQFRNSDPQSSDIDDLKAALKPKK